MATKTLDTNELAVLAATADEAGLTTYVDALPKADVPVALVRANPVKKALAFFEKACEQRIIGEAILGLGETWVDKETGVIYTFGGAAGDNDCRDPEALIRALVLAGVPEKDIARAIPQVYKVDFRLLKELGKRSDATLEAIEDHVTRKPFGPPHLKEAK